MLLNKSRDFSGKLGLIDWKGHNESVNKLPVIIQPVKPTYLGNELFPYVPLKNIYNQVINSKEKKVYFS